jgi:aspartyl-tRNA(Asn)/glutamyl-tRNA(Gln) amidotransferase subunit B
VFIPTPGRDLPKWSKPEGLKVTDTGAIEAAVDDWSPPIPIRWLLRENPKLAGWFVGQVMKATGGKYNPKAVDLTRVCCKD